MKTGDRDEKVERKKNWMVVDGIRMRDRGGISSSLETQSSMVELTLTVKNGS